MTTVGRVSTTVKQRFGPTQGLVTGWVGMVAVAAVTVGVLADRQDVVGIRIALMALCFGVVVWCFMLRPRVGVEAGRVHLINPLRDTSIPVTRIDQFSIGAATAVRVGERKYVGIGVGRKRNLGSAYRQRAGGMHGRLQEIGTPSRQVTGLADFVERQIDDSRSLAKYDPPLEDQEIHRIWAVPELAVFGVLLVGVVVTFVI